MKEIYKSIGIYRITNLINGKSYIGKTGMNFGDRWDSHRSLLNSGKHDNPHLQRAWSKYGQQNFEFEIVEKLDNAKDLNEREMFWIAEYRSCDKCYNIHDGGDGGMMLGKHLSEDTKRKIGEKNRINMTGRKASVETKRRMSESQKLRFEKMSDEDKKAYGKRMSECASGYKWSDESKQSFAKKQHEKPNGARFTADDIREIRKKRDEGMTLAALAAEYHTSTGNISNIVRRRRWANI